MLWQLIELQMGISHFYHFKKNTEHYMIIFASIVSVIVYLFMKTIYYLLYPISYKVEGELEKWSKVVSMGYVFSTCVFLTLALFNFDDSKQYELGYLAIFIICTLLVLNVIVTLNPIERYDQGVDMYQRSCCSGKNLMMTISFLFCFKVLELHHFLVATDNQNKVFYNPFHIVISIWLLGLWINIQKVPERLFPESPIVQKFFNSDIIKSAVVIWAVLSMHYLLKDAMVLKDNHGQIIQ